MPYRERRRRLEVLFAARGLRAPWTLCPMTTDLAKAREWPEYWTDVSSVEGILIKNTNQRYLPNHRGWCVNCTFSGSLPPPAPNPTGPCPMGRAHDSSGTAW
ncbi:hypothetical protein [Streptomyces sp. NPDC060333]|uniref:hypothetical protein n=1 Tax=Streptomyces sp. NPDC060333 TaxID=3347098 RepID=UPI003661656B